MILSDVLTVLSLPCALSCPYKNTLFLQRLARCTGVDAVYLVDEVVHSCCTDSTVAAAPSSKMRHAWLAILVGTAASARTTSSADDCIATEDPVPPLQRVPAPRASKVLRIAIATLISANNQDPCKGTGQMRPYGCGLLPWCTSARRLQAALAPMFRSVEVIAVHSSRLADDPQLSTDERRRRAGKSVAVTGYEGKLRKDCRFNMDTERLDVADCPGVRIITPTRRMLNVSAQHAERIIASGLMSYYPNYIRRGYVFLWKFEYWRL